MLLFFDGFLASCGSCWKRFYLAESRSSRSYRSGPARDNLRDGDRGGLSALPIIRGFPGPLAQAGMKSHLWRLEMRVIRTASGSMEYRPMLLYFNWLRTTCGDRK